MKYALILAWLCWLTLPTIGATFGPDGETVYFEGTTGALGTLNTITGEEGRLDLGKSVGALRIIAVAHDGDASLLVLVEDGIWRIDPDTGAGHRLLTSDYPFAENSEIAFDPVTGGILIAHYSKERNDYSAQWVPKGASVQRSVRSVVTRGVRMVASPVFDPSGDLYFCDGGDIWRGRLVPDPDEEDFSTTDLQADRYAPVAMLQCGNWTPSSTGAQILCVAGPHIYAQVNRMGGSGWGTTVRLLKAEKPLSEDGKGAPGSLEDYGQMAARALQSLEPLAESGGMRTLCASPDGTRVLFSAASSSRAERVGNFHLLKTESPASR